MFVILQCESGAGKWQPHRLAQRTRPRVPNSQEVKKEAARLMKIFLSNKQAIGVGECLLVHVHVKVKSLDWKTREALS